MQHLFSEKIQRLNYAINEIGALYHDAAVLLGLSDSAFNIFYVLCEEPQPTQSLIAGRLGISRQTVNSAVAKLQKEGLVYLEAGERRTQYIRLTAQGEALVREKMYPIIRIENEIFDSWSETDQTEYIRLNQKYRDAFRDRLSALER